MGYTIIYYIFLILILCIFGKYNWSRRKLYVLAAQLSGPWALPFIGNALQVMWRKEEILKKFIKLMAPYSSPTRVWLGPRLVLVLKNPDQVQTILQSSKTNNKAFLYRFFEPFLGKGLLTSSGSVHKSHRKLLQPLFSQRMVDGYSHLFEKHAKKFVEQIRKHVDGLEFDILLYLHNESFECAFDVLLDEELDSNDHKYIIQFLDRFNTTISHRVHSFWLHFEFIYERTSYFKEQTMMKQTFHKLMEKIFDKKVLEVVQKLKNSQSLPGSKEIRIPSILEAIKEMMLEDPNCLTAKEFSDNLTTLIAASLDTQSTTMAFLCMMLGAYPKIQCQVVKELREVLSNRTSIDLTDVSKLKYLEMCVKETLRLFPVGPFIIRDSIETFQLGDLIIPENVTILSSVYHLHRDPNSWEKPDEFYPEHFRPEAATKRHPYAFIPFSSGTRKCIAQQYSYTNMKIIIATMLLNYEIECSHKVEDINLTADISVRPVDGHFIKIKRRF